MKKYRDFIFLLIVLAFMLLFIGNSCPLEHIIGIPCPGCNMFTSLYWLLHGNFALATYYHPAVWAFLLYIVIVLILFLRDSKNFTKHKSFQICTASFLVILIGVYAYRMVIMFPNYPMTLNENAIFMKLFHLF